LLKRSSVPRENNFDLLRTAFAFIVFLVHAYVLSQRAELEFLSRWLSSEFAVESFFVVSGFLVVMSFHRSRSLGDYAEKRLRRIYPAYLAVVAACAFGGVLLTHDSPTDYFGAEWIRYIAANLAFLNFLQHELPGVFQGNPVAAVNGALWTLKIEVAFYLSVPLIALLAARFGRVRILAGLYLGAVVYGIGMEMLARESDRGIYVLLQRQLPGQLGYFVAGAAGYYYLGALQRLWKLLVPIALVLLVLPMSRELVLAIRPAVLGIVVVYLAVGLRYLGNFGRYGDMSYGIYIIHFPVVQTLVSFDVFNANPYLALGIASAAVLSGALLSWHLIEKPFLRKSSHYVLATEATGDA
jgi:peptidoglycan/LPS O-acetylase OafA/YrhL